MSSNPWSRTPLRQIAGHFRDDSTGWHRSPARSGAFDSRMQESLPMAFEGGPFEEIDTELGPLWMLASDEVMRPYLLKRKTWEEGEAALLRTIIKPGCRFLDVGANVGYFSLFAWRAAPDVSIDAVEPHPLLHRLLRANLWSNRAAARVWNVALGSERSLLPLASAAMNPGDTRLGSGSTASLVVPCTKADELFPNRSFDVVKIDVQGWENEVIAGMEQIVRRSPGMIIVAEFWPTALRDRGSDPGEVLNWYRAMGYSMAVQDDRGLDHLAPGEIITRCDSAGPNGQVNLVLRRD